MNLFLDWMGVWEFEGVVWEYGPEAIVARIANPLRKNRISNPVYEEAFFFIPCFQEFVGRPPTAAFGRNQNQYYNGF